MPISRLVSMLPRLGALPPLATRALAAAAMLALPAALAQAPVSIVSLTPQGTVATVRQVVAKFSADAVAFGDPRAPAPLAVRCEGGGGAGEAVPGGQGRWSGAREWIYEFAADLPAGTRCRVAPAPGFKTPAGAGLAGVGSYQFDTGGPAVARVRPYDGATVDEEQVFALQLTGAATPESVRAHVWCKLDGVGERVPVRLLDGQPRADVLRALHLADAAARAPARVVVFQCARRLTPETPLQIVFGRGVATPGGVENATEKRFDYTVRAPFAARVSCERENAQAACLPIRPIEVQFTAPVAAADAAKLRLAGGGVDLLATVDEDDRRSGSTERVRFVPAGAFPERAQLTLTVPARLKDEAGRALANAAAFPMAVATGAMPPLAKFAAAPFGIVERFAEGPDGPALLPLTLRRVEPELAAAELTVGDLRPQSDADIIRWMARVQRFEQSHVARADARRELGQRLPAPVDEQTKDAVESRTVSLLAGQPDVRTLAIAPPKGAGAAERPFEVIGVPLAPGFHVVELTSPRLGAALLNPKYGPARAMVVRTSVLVTNLAVHVKLGRTDSLAWVTRLDTGKPVAAAAVRVSDCAGRQVAAATTDERGVARLARLPPEAPRCDGPGAASEYSGAYFVSARAGSGPAADMAFAWSSWQRGIEPWRFNVPTSRDAAPDVLAHTVFDRTLLRAGETVSMKHLVRTQTPGGFGLPKADAATLVITHVGSDQEFTQPLKWRATATGGRSAESTFAIPPAARLGLYQVALRVTGAGGGEGTQTLPSGQFRVEEFRLPVLKGSVGPAGEAPLVGATAVPVQVQIGYVAGGAAAGLPVRVSATVRPRVPSFDAYDGYSFQPPRPARGGTDAGDGDGDGDGEAEGDESDARGGAQLVADKLPLTLDAGGAGRVTLSDLPPSPAPRALAVEATFADPNGEIQTLRGGGTLWPAGVIAGIKAEHWVSTDRTAQVQALALGLDGKPRAGVPLDVRATARITTTSRKRMVGGVYAYDSRTETKDLGTVCSGKSDAHGVLECKARLGEPGEIELVASARDEQGRAAQAAASVWVTRQGELWFGGENHDRMDVLAEKTHVAPGETARLQVRMPFREATALVTVEREGILETRVVTLRGDDPTVEVKVGETWSPNVYVTVLALRGRLYEVPWYSFFTWGYRQPRQWWDAFWHGRTDYAAPTALVDLAKPAFRLGMAELKVGGQAHQLAVRVKADQERYPVRGQARVAIEANLLDGRPAASATSAPAAVDEALLELQPNTSWALLQAMLARRDWGVQTATAQMEIVGRRHYGRKAVPAGGDGGTAPTRELLDTLLLWNPRITLDAQGRANAVVPMNDALSSFRIVAVADAGTGLFGTGHTSVRTAQDLQIVSGLPPLVRAGDRFTALVTLRNTTERPMQVDVAPRAPGLTLAPQAVALAPGAAREVTWDVAVPPQHAAAGEGALVWEIAARDTTAGSPGARDALKVTQRVLPAVPVRVQQATLVQLDGPFTQDVAPPAGALPGQGGVRLAVQPRLGGDLPGVREWFRRYPYACLEQQSSVAIGLRDVKAWQRVAAQLPAYLDADGLAYYFPPRAGGEAGGSDTLSAWLLAATHEAARIDPAFALPDAVKAQLIAGLTQFVEGRIERKFFSPRADLDVRKLAAIEALARHGAARPAMLGSIAIAPNQWPSSAVLDWVSVLQRMRGIPAQAERLAEARQVLRARLAYQGTRIAFATEESDRWWWLMAGGDVNAARLLLAALDDPDWAADVGRLATGLIGRQQRGAWDTTTANLWGSLALEQFSKTREHEPVTGHVQATLDPLRSRRIRRMRLPPRRRRRALCRARPRRSPPRRATRRRRAR